MKQLPQVLTSIGILLLTLAAVNASVPSHSITQETTNPVSVEQSQVTATPSATTSIRELSHQPTQITIGNQIDLPITQEYYHEGAWSISETAASHLKTSGLPYEADNIIIYGHNKDSIMGPLRWLSGDEQIRLTLADGSERVYKITSMQQVTTDRVDLLHSTNKEILTVYTCAGLFDRERFVVQAEPINLEAELAEAAAKQEALEAQQQTEQQHQEIIASMHPWQGFVEEHLP